MKRVIVPLFLLGLTLAAAPALAPPIGKGFEAREQDNRCGRLGSGFGRHAPPGGLPVRSRSKLMSELPSSS